MSTSLFAGAAAALVLTTACSSSRQPPGAETPREGAPAAAPASGHGPSDPTPAAAPQHLVKPAASPSSSGEPCGPLECQRFSDVAAAFEHVLETEPLVLGVGEAHLLAANAGVRSTARRFAEDLLPVLDGRASHLIVEILRPNPSCTTITRDVQESHEPVTREQAPSNQNDYVALGHRARALGIEPFLLSATCDEYAAIADAGPDAILRTLTTIADVTTRMALAALKKNHERAAGSRRIVLAYGGALHNDAQPQASRASYSYGPRLLAATGGRYVELDLIVRELIKDTETWRALPWFGHFDPERDPESTIVMHTAPHSYVLFFPRTHAMAPPG